MPATTASRSRLQIPSPPQQSASDPCGRPGAALNPKSMNVAAYARVSTETRTLKFSSRRSDSIWLNEDGPSWPHTPMWHRAKENRPAFRRLLADAARRRFEAVIVQRFDRAARSVKQLVATLDHLRRCRVAFVSIKEDVDTSTPAGELILHVMAAIGQFERALIGDRIRSGLQRARALGRRIGRPSKGGSREQVRALRQTGLSYRAIGRCLKISTALAHRMARNASSEGDEARLETSHAGFETASGPSLSEGASHANRGLLAR